MRNRDPTTSRRLTSKVGEGAGTAHIHDKGALAAPFA
jgi:hypothetical protein